ncbi:prepilin peptidase [Nitrosomonas oligotropha]|uniref:Prepilin leader peptidase/N-methyltransferase n=1 Tax=Nitrosomonas oligotropha TaxID=42354 RepID=A0A1H8U9M5_9PROT|nr:A24 family peptidase [Nitrosomonas oligotropha]SDX26038.1 type 4 prepilin peptidase 1 Aspartic peptidase. MEROPS family A24A [Nitrosomonas oligotropha]SEO99875.1 type 4 prepilin peptidase 1 Aspartic peptidase. MEROPS family A24A [Nitrosomonas oligotropha]
MSFLSILQDSPVFFVSCTTILGLMIGSFLNVVIYRLPEMMKRNWLQQCAELQGEAIQTLPKLNLFAPRSTCIHCEHKITAWENIPVISYLFLRGRCSQCHASISPRYPMVEAATAIISGFVAWHFGYGFIALAALIFVWSLIALAAIDLDTQLLPDDITLPLLWIGLLVNINHGFTDIQSAVIGAIAGYVSLWSIYWCFKLITGKEGMGYGDFKLLAAIGAWLGWGMLPLVILSSSLVGALVGMGLILAAKLNKNIPIPFGPYLVGGALIALFWGEQLIHTYIGLF